MKATSYDYRELGQVRTSFVVPATPDKLVVDGQQQTYVQSILAYLRKLCSCLRYTVNPGPRRANYVDYEIQSDPAGTPEELAKKVDQDCWCREQPGCTLVADLLSQNKTVHVVYRPMMSMYASGEQLGLPGDTVIFDPNYDSSRKPRDYFGGPGMAYFQVRATGDYQLRPLQGDAALFGHELIHVWSNWHNLGPKGGSGVRESLFLARPGGLGTIIGLGKALPSELATVGIDPHWIADTSDHYKLVQQRALSEAGSVTENALRAQMGMDLRMHYTLVPVPAQ